MIFSNPDKFWNNSVMTVYKYTVYCMQVIRYYTQDL